MAAASYRAGGSSPPPGTWGHCESHLKSPSVLIRAQPLPLYPLNTAPAHLALRARLRRHTHGTDGETEARRAAPRPRDLRPTRQVQSRAQTRPQGPAHGPGLGRGPRGGGGDSLQGNEQDPTRLRLREGQPPLGLERRVTTTWPQGRRRATRRRWGEGHTDADGAADDLAGSSRRWERG